MGQLFALEVCARELREVVVDTVEASLELCQQRFVVHLGSGKVVAAVSQLLFEVAGIANAVEEALHDLS